LVIQFCFGRENMIIEPGHQLQVIGQPPEAGHGGVGVGIDQPRHNDSAAGINNLGYVPVAEFIGWSDGRNGISADGNCAINDFAIVCI
jgi:hypothetical protein